MVKTLDSKLERSLSSIPGHYAATRYVFSAASPTVSNNGVQLLTAN